MDVDISRPSETPDMGTTGLIVSQILEHAHQMEAAYSDSSSTAIRVQAHDGNTTWVPA